AGPPLNISVYITVVSFGAIKEINMYIIIVIIIITILYQTIDIFNFAPLTINLSKTYLKFFLRPKYRMNENISICVMSKEFSLDIFFKQAWNDPRLVHELKKPILLSGSDKSNFWLPDTFFLNVKTAKFHHVPAANSRIAINPNGDVELSERLTVSASCRMDLRDYPLDTQTCILEILSCNYIIYSIFLIDSYDINDMDYHWDDAQALIILDDEMSEFELADAQIERKLVEYVIGTYTHLVAKFVFRRRLEYSFIQIYSPTFLIVVLSWLSFWISKDAVPARVALGITTVLTIVTLMGSLRNSVPKVSYIKAIDSYLIVSFIFVFGVLLEYVAVLMHSERKKAKARGKRSTSKDYSMAEMEIETFHTKDSEVVPRSHSSYSLPPRPKSAHGFPPRSPSSYSLPQKSALRNSYPRQVKVS
ncbi:unnamed protein product, partial [Porites evermanni]